MNSHSKNEGFSLNKKPRKRRPKLVSKSAILEKLIITGLKSNAIFFVVQKCCNFNNPTHNNALCRVSSNLGQIIAKFAYILLS